MKKFVIAASAAALFATSAVLPARAAPAPIYLGAYGGILSSLPMGCVGDHLSS